MVLPEIFKDVNNTKSAKATSGAIFVVDDDVFQHEIIRRCYESSKRTSELVLMSSGEELLKKMDKISEENLPEPKLILLDINMPGLGGFHTLQELRKRDEFRNTPIVIMFTASCADSDREKSKEYGANGFWTKPENIADYINLFQSM